MTQALTFTIGTRRYYVVDELRPHKTREMYDHLKAFSPEHEPELVEVEIRRVEPKA